MKNGSLCVPWVRKAAKLLGGETTGVHVLCPGPGHSSSDRSLSVRFLQDAPDGFIVHSFAGDDPLQCRDYVREQLGLPTRDFRKRNLSNPPPRLPQQAPDDQIGRIRAGLAIWAGARSMLGTPAATYFASRGLRLDEDLAYVLRFSASLKLDKKPAAGIVALYRDTATNEPCGIHRTFLHPDGRPILELFENCSRCAPVPCKGHKIRKMLGRAQGAAIKLDPHEDVVSGLHLAEGIESGLSGRQLGYRPVWALGSVGAIAAFPVLAGIEAITVLAENDIASSKAANEVCGRYENAGCEAWISAPTEGDFNDLIRGQP
jgi:putative DNA primase/helicase